MADRHFTRDDLIQVEHPLYSHMLEERMATDENDLTKMACRYLGVDRANLASTTERMPPLIADAVALELSRIIATDPQAKVLGAAPGTAPEWRRFPIEETVERIPEYVSVWLQPGPAVERPMVLALWREHGVQQVCRVFLRGEDDEYGRQYLGDLVDRARGPNSPYRGRTLQASVGAYGLDLELLPDFSDSREDLFFPEDVWEAVDLNVSRMLSRMEVLSAAGLGTNRGLLLAGPPGTGKTALCRALAAENAGRVTAVLCTPSVGMYYVQALYAEIGHLTPAIVFLEDLDIVVGNREDGAGSAALVSFLTTLDGLMTRHEQVISVATTNEPESIDAAARRAARFDRVVHLELPTESARRSMLERFLRAVPHEVDVDAAAERTHGLSGADVRELVRSAVIRIDGSITTDDLLGTLA